jgi:hypothetical protein
MMEDFRQEFESTMTPLLRGILDDTQKLFRQEIALARVEVTEDAMRARDAVVGISVGAMMGYIAFIFVCFAAVYLLVANEPRLPVWGAYGIVAVVLAAVSWIFTSRGIRRAREIRGIPQQTVDTIQQGFQWMQRRA